MENRLRDSLPWLIDCFVRWFFAAEENAFSEALVLLLCSYEVLICDKSSHTITEVRIGAMCPHYESNIPLVTSARVFHSV